MIPLKIKLTKKDDTTIEFQIIQQDEALLANIIYRPIFTSTNRVQFYCISYPSIQPDWIATDTDKIIYLRGNSKSQDNIIKTYSFPSPLRLSSFVSDLTIAVAEFNAYIADKEHL